MVGNSRERLVMSELSFGKLLLTIGAGIVLIGLLAIGLEKLGVSLGRLPGDIHIRGEKGSFHFPIVTCIVISILATLLFHLIGRK